MLWRFFNGSKRLLTLACFDRASLWHYGYRSQAGLAALGIGIGAAIMLRRKSGGEILKYAHIACYPIALLVVYALGAAWYVPISGNNVVRIALVIIVPLFWTVGLALHRPRVCEFQLTILGRPVNVVRLLLGMMYLTLLYEIYMMLVPRAWTMCGGS